MKQQQLFCLGILHGSQAIGFYDCIPKGLYSGTSTCMKLRPDGVGHDIDGNYRDAMIYNAFVWAQLFNEVNARKIRDELNPFDGVMAKWMRLSRLREAILDGGLALAAGDAKTSRSK